MRKILTYKDLLVDMILVERDSCHLHIFGLTVLKRVRTVLKTPWLSIGRPCKPIRIDEGM